MGYVLYCDGASKGNPGDAGIGAIFIDPKQQITDSLSQYIGQTTNNIAEYTSLLYGLDLPVKHGIRHIDVYMDSDIVVSQINGDYNIKAYHLLRLYRQIMSIIVQFKSFTIQRIPREQNWLADKLANLAVERYRYQEG
jgi:ribonuclease HI